MFLRQYQRERKCFLSERELKRALRDTLTRAAWLGPSNFWLVHSEHAHASYPGLFFRPPGFSPYMGREERRVQGLDYTSPGLTTWANVPRLPGWGRGVGGGVWWAPLELIGALQCTIKAQKIKKNHWDQGNTLTSVSPCLFLFSNILWGVAPALTEVRSRNAMNLK